MGVFDDKGRYIHEAVLWRGRPLMVEPEVPTLADDLPGRWIWAGVLLNHFGHFLTESLGRLWALQAVKGKVDGLLFVPKRDGQEDGGVVEMQQFHRLFFALTKIDLPIRILTRPTRVELLEVPGQGFGIGPMAAGTSSFRAFMAEHFARDVAPVGGEQLYISRSGLSARRGGILGEERLELLLEQEGYEIYHPQKHSLVDQVARYKSARQIIALDGSALHLVAFTGVRDQQVAVIKRRDSHASDGIVTHLTAFLGIVPDVIDVILQDWVRSDRRKADRLSIGELDFNALGFELEAKGYIHSGESWPSLTPDEARAAIRDIEESLRRENLTYRPIQRNKQRQILLPNDAKVEFHSPQTRPAPSRRELRMMRRKLAEE